MQYFFFTFFICLQIYSKFEFFGTFGFFINKNLNCNQKLIRLFNQIFFQQENAEFMEDFGNMEGCGKFIRRF
jgi:hypothetical protein